MRRGFHFRHPLQLTVSVMVHIMSEIRRKGATLLESSKSASPRYLGCMIPFGVTAHELSKLLGINVNEGETEAARTKGTKNL